MDVAERAGLRHASVYGGLDHKRFIIETNGAGVAWLDYDDDGKLDAFVLSGTRLVEGGRAAARHAGGGAPTNRLYRNRGDGTFADVTDAASGSAAPAGPPGCASATTTTTGGSTCW